MSFVCLYVHCVWGTKNRFPYFTEGNTADVIWHISKVAREKGILIDHINVYRDHIHCLISLGPDQKLADIIRQIKGESSFWINRNLSLPRDFKWAQEYYASAVSIKQIPTVRNYILTQKEHHSNKTWKEEETAYSKMITKLLAPFRIPL